MTALRLPRRAARYQPRHALPETEQQRARQRSSTLGVMLVLLITSGFVAGTTASFTGSTTNPSNRFATAALDPPSNVGGEMSGTAADLTWFAALGPSNSGAGYEVLWADGGPPTNAQGTAPDCATASGFTKIGHTSAASYSDSSADSRQASPSARPGRWSCYQVRTVYPYPPNASPWTSQGANPIKEVQVGFVARGVNVENNSSGSNVMRTGDIIRVTFNQPVAVSSGPPAGTTASTGNAPRICTTWSAGYDEILIGATGAHNATCASTETTTVGRLIDPQGDTRLTRQSRYTVTWTWGDCKVAGTSCRVLTGTLGARVNPSGGGTANDAGTTNADPWVFIPSSTLLSATGALPICTVDPTGGLCRPQNGGNW